MDQMRGEFTALIAAEEHLREERAAAARRTASGVHLGLRWRRRCSAARFSRCRPGGSFKAWPAEYAEAAATTRRQAQAIEESAERLRLTIDTALDAVIGADAEGVITDWNAQAETIFGRSRAEAVGRGLDETIIPERYRDTRRKGLAHFLRTGEGPMLNQRIEMSALRRDGAEFPIEIAIVPIQSAGSAGFSAFIRDLSESKQAAAERERLSHYNQLLLDSTGEGMYGLDRDGNCTFLNRMGAQMLGVTADEALGKNMHRLTHYRRADGTEYPADDCPIYRALREGRSCRVEDDVFLES